MPNYSNEPLTAKTLKPPRFKVPFGPLGSSGPSGHDLWGCKVASGTGMLVADLLSIVGRVVGQSHESSIVERF